MIYVCIGLGFHLKMTHDEALSFIAEKTADLEAQAEKLNSKANHIKSLIKVVCFVAHLPSK